MICMLAVLRPSRALHARVLALLHHLRSRLAAALLLSHHILLQRTHLQHAECLAIVQVCLLAGGPPCQGISGHNRQARTNVVKLLHDSQNSLLGEFCEAVRLLRPEYVAMEQVHLWQCHLQSLGG